MWLYRATRVFKPVARIYWRIRLIGEVDSIPRSGPLILAGNHTSFLDPYVLGFAFPRPIRFLITRDWYDKSAIWRMVFRGFNSLPVERRLERSVETVCKSLERGEVVGIYPEGRISYDGRIQRFRSGIAHFAAASGAPVLPLGIHGPFQSLPRTRRIPKRATITFNVGSPLYFPGSPLSSAPDVRATVDFRNQLFEEVCRLSDQPALTSAPQPGVIAMPEPAGSISANQASELHPQPLADKYEVGNGR